MKYFRKEVEFGEGKVLLSKIGGSIHATSAFCTHYGAPLASECQNASNTMIRVMLMSLIGSLEGVLVASGRVTWYVATSTLIWIQ